MLATTLEEPALVTDEVPKILGRPAQSFEQWVAEHRDIFTN
ncbi:NAD(P)H azoreductase [Mycobacterium xenopi]|nr:NAD(P)H azoreductase [Mycobacterium xenopi]